MDQGVLREYLFKEVELVQAIIDRMSTNSFFLKGAAVTLIGALLFVDGNTYSGLVTFLPGLAFWSLDAYFLRTEHLYRELHRWLVTNRLKSEEFLLDLDRKSIENRFGKAVKRQRRIMFSKTLITFYGLIFLMITVGLVFKFLEKR
jgi:hypothetical protein